MDPIRALHLSYTKRWVIAPTHRDQSVAEHTFRVMLIAEALCIHLGYDPYAFFVAHLLRDAMYHDFEEQTTGDVPGPQKDKTPGYLKDVDKMTVTECVIKVADSIETGTYWVQWGNGEAWHGHPSNNAPARDVNKIFHYSRKQLGLLNAAMDVWRLITGKDMPIGERYATRRAETEEDGLRTLPRQRNPDPIHRGDNADAEGVAAPQCLPETSA